MDRPSPELAGLLAPIGIGFLGVLLGGWLARVLGLPSILALASSR